MEYCHSSLHRALLKIFCMQTSPWVASAHVNPHLRRERTDHRDGVFQLLLSPLGSSDSKRSRIILQKQFVQRATGRCKFLCVSVIDYRLAEQVDCYPTARFWGTSSTANGGICVSDAASGRSVSEAYER